MTHVLLYRLLAAGIIAAGMAGTVSAIDRLRVPGPVQARKLLKRVPVEYPREAITFRIHGTVRFNALIGADGRVKKLALVSGHPMLKDAARKAAGRYVYEPTEVHGKAVEVLTIIEVRFRLGPDGRLPRNSDRNMRKAARDADGLRS